MEYDDFIRRVQKKANLETPEAAARAAGATIESIGEHLDGTGRRRLSAQLPQQLSRHIQGRRHLPGFDLDEFYIRVGTRADLAFPDAVKRSRAVVEVLREEVDLAQFLSHAGEEMAELLGGEPPREDPALADEA